MKQIIIIIIIFVVFYILNNINFIENFNFHKKENVILLTMCVNTVSNNSYNDQQYRINLYKNTINKYLKNTNLNIFIIESSNNQELKNLYKNNNRINIHTFDLIKKYDIYSYYKSKERLSTICELFSLKEAYNVFNLNQYNFILKITGRYYIPNIEHIIKNLNNYNTFYIQYRNLGNDIFGTELLIFKSFMFDKILNYTLKNNLILEKSITNLCNQYSYSKLSKIKLENNVYRGGDKIKIKYL